jgi:hypothetical protein
VYFTSESEFNCFFIARIVSFGGIVSYATTLCVSGEILSLPWFSKELKQLIKKQLTSWRHPYTSRSRINIHCMGVFVSNIVGA